MMPRRRSMFDQIDPTTGFPIMDGQEAEVPPAPDYQSFYPEEEEQETPGMMSVVDKYMQSQMPEGATPGIMPTDDMMLGPNAALQGAEGAGMERGAMSAYEDALAADKKNSTIKGIGQIASALFGGAQPLDTSGIDQKTDSAYARAQEAQAALARYNDAQAQDEERDYAQRSDGVERSRQMALDAQRQSNADRDFDAERQERDRSQDFEEQRHADSLKESARNRALQRELAAGSASAAGAEARGQQTLEDTKKHTAVVEATQNINDALDRIEQTYAQVGGSGNNARELLTSTNLMKGNTIMGADKAALDADVAGIHAELKNLNNTGTWDKGSAELLGKMAGLNLTGFNSVMSTEAGRKAVRNLRERLNAQLQSSARARGFAGEEKNLQALGSEATGAEPSAPPQEPGSDMSGVGPLMKRKQVNGVWYVHDGKGWRQE